MSNESEEGEILGKNQKEMLEIRQKGRVSLMHSTVDWTCLSIDLVRTKIGQQHKQVNRIKICQQHIERERRKDLSTFKNYETQLQKCNICLIEIPDKEETEEIYEVIMAENYPKLIMH